MTYRRKPTVRTLIINLTKKVDILMATDADVLASVEVLKTDLTAKVAEAVAELAKLEGEITNPAALDNIKSIVDGLDASVKAAVVPTA